MTRWLRGGRKKRGVRKAYTKLTEKLRSPSQDYTDDPRDGKVNCLPLPRILATRNPIHELHRLFPSIPEEETPLNVFACALSKEILLQGKMFVTQNYVCFYSNIFGFETKVIIELKDVVLIKREKTVFVVPNAIALKTLRKRFFFCSFLSRETVYKLLSRTWQKALIEAASDYSGRGLDSSEDSDPGSFLGRSNLDISTIDDVFIPENRGLDNTDYLQHNNNNTMHRNNHKNEDSSKHANSNAKSSHHNTPLTQRRNQGNNKRLKSCPFWPNTSREVVLWFKIRISSHFKRKTTVASFCSFLLIILVLAVFMTSLLLMLRIYFLSNVIHVSNPCPGCSKDSSSIDDNYQDAFYETIGRMRQVVSQNMKTVQKAYAVLDDLNEKISSKTTPDYDLTAH